jgi:hypothetical protein
LAGLLFANVIACDKREAFAQGSVSSDPPSLAERTMARLEFAEAGGSNPVRTKGLDCFASLAMTEADILKT